LARCQPQPDGRKPNEGKVIASKLVVARRDPTTLLDRIEKPFDPVAGAVE